MACTPSAAGNVLVLYGAIEKAQGGSGTAAGCSLIDRPQVSIGYNLNFNPWKLSINKGLFERVTGYTVSSSPTNPFARGTHSLCRSNGLRLKTLTKQSWH